MSGFPSGFRGAFQEELISTFSKTLKEVSKMMKTLLAFHLMAFSFLIFDNHRSKTVHIWNVIMNLDLFFGMPVCEHEMYLLVPSLLQPPGSIFVPCVASWLSYMCTDVKNGLIRLLIPAICQLHDHRP